MKVSTSWEKSADWYQNLLTEENTYQKDLILPNLLRLLEIKKGETILDLACGPGFFAKEFFKKGARVIGADISESLIKAAKENSPETIRYYVSPAVRLPFIKSSSINKITIILAIQNMDNVRGIFTECARALKPGGKLLLVLNHPAFRNPKQSEWEWDAEKKIQYRRMDSYLSESKAKIDMRPSTSSQPMQGSGGQARQVPSEYTISFHRPLQFYFKALEKSGFAVTRLEEWNSNKKSRLGPRAEAENKARKEIPLFLFLEARK